MVAIHDLPVDLHPRRRGLDPPLCSVEATAAVPLAVLAAGEAGEAEEVDKAGNSELEGYLLALHYWMTPAQTKTWALDVWRKPVQHPWLILANLQRCARYLPRKYHNQRVGRVR